MTLVEILTSHPQYGTDWWGRTTTAGVKVPCATFTPSPFIFIVLQSAFGKDVSHHSADHGVYDFLDNALPSFSGLVFEFFYV